MAAASAGLARTVHQKFSRLSLLLVEENSICSMMLQDFIILICKTFLLPRFLSFWLHVALRFDLISFLLTQLI